MSYAWRTTEISQRQLFCLLPRGEVRLIEVTARDGGRRVGVGNANLSLAFLLPGAREKSFEIYFITLLLQKSAKSRMNYVLASELLCNKLESK